jgi:hypothetical protein
VLPGGVMVFLLALQAPQDRPATGGPQHLELRLFETNGMASNWWIDMIPSGEVSRGGDAPLGPRYVSPEARQRLRTLLAKEKFFTLAEEYGGCPIDGRMRIITAVLNGRRHAVVLCDLPVKGAGAAARRLLRVWYGALTALVDDVRIEKNDALVLHEPS